MSDNFGSCFHCCGFFFSCFRFNNANHLSVILPTATATATATRSTTEIPINETKLFLPPIQSGEVIDVYDGDTITVATSIRINDETNMYRFAIRLKGIDTPELRSKNKVEKELALNARNALYNRIFGKMVDIKNISHDKYGGRFVADVFFGKEHINAFMVEKKYAVPYDGKTKKFQSEEWETWAKQNTVIPLFQDTNYFLKNKFHSVHFQNEIYYTPNLKDGLVFNPQKEIVGYMNNNKVIFFKEIYLK